jgi:hypothetical protein
VKKAVWNSNKPRRFPKANLIIYRTTETPDLHAEVHRLLDDGQIAQLAGIAAMHAG